MNKSLTIAFVCSAFLIGAAIPTLYFTNFGQSQEYHTTISTTITYSELTKTENQGYFLANVESVSYSPASNVSYVVISIPNVTGISNILFGCQAPSYIQQTGEFPNVQQINALVYSEKYYFVNGSNWTSAGPCKDFISSWVS